MRAFRAPLGPGPYGITTTPTGRVFYASLAGNHIAEINVKTGKATVIRPPTANQGARRVWSDSKGRIWVSEWDAGKVGRYDPATKKWREWDAPGPAQVYAVYVDSKDMVWLTDFGRSGPLALAPKTGKFTRFLCGRTRACVSCWDGLARCGVPSRARPARRRPRLSSAHQRPPSRIRRAHAVPFQTI